MPTGRARTSTATAVRLADGVRVADAEQAIRAALADTPIAQVRDQAAAVAGRTQMLDLVLGLVTALLMLTIGIAVMGISNTLAEGCHLIVRAVSREYSAWQPVGHGLRMLGFVIVRRIVNLAGLGGLCVPSERAQRAAEAEQRAAQLWVGQVADDRRPIVRDCSSSKPRPSCTQAVCTAMCVSAGNSVRSASSSSRACSSWPPSRSSRRDQMPNR
jgi:hypothetical protein